MKQKIKIILGILLLSGILAAMPASMVLAQGSGPPGAQNSELCPTSTTGGRGNCPIGQCVIKGGTECVLSNPAPGQLVSTSDFSILLKNAIGWALYFAGSIAVIFLIVGGYQYITSRGNEEAMERAKRTIGAAILGIVLVVMAYAIVVIINDLLTTKPPGT